MKFSATVSTPAVAIGVGPVAVDLMGGAQVQHEPQPELVDQPAHVLRGRPVQRGAAQEDAGAGAAAVAEREATDVAHVVEALEAHPPVDHEIDTAKPCGFSDCDVDEGNAAYGAIRPPRRLRRGE
jgi:hypothetical protein